MSFFMCFSMKLIRCFFVLKLLVSRLLSVVMMMCFICVFGSVFCSVCVKFLNMMIVCVLLFFNWCVSLCVV